MFPSEQAYRRFQRRVDRLSFLIVATDISERDISIERLFLVSRGRRLPIAGFLSPPEKESFADALAAAIGEAKRGPTRTVI